jgi:hypothetical protein
LTEANGLKGTGPDTVSDMASRAAGGGGGGAWLGPALLMTVAGGTEGDVLDGVGDGVATGLDEGGATTLGEAAGRLGLAVTGPEFGLSVRA